MSNKQKPVTEQDASLRVPKRVRKQLGKLVELIAQRPDQVGIPHLYATLGRIVDEALTKEQAEADARAEESKEKEKR